MPADFTVPDTGVAGNAAIALTVREVEIAAIEAKYSIVMAGVMLASQLVQGASTHVAR